MTVSPRAISTHGLSARLCLLALAGCSSEPLPMRADAAPTVDADAAPIEEAGVDVAPDVAPPDAPSACVDASGAWEWTATCDDPRYLIDPSTCSVQTGCTVTDILNFPATLVGNVATRALNRRLEMVNGTVTVTYNGDTATMRLVATGPIVLTCTGTGRRLTFPGASRYCCNVGRNDCGAGQRCAPVEGGRSLFTACLADGATPAGMSCTRTMERVGTDTCVAGQTCAEDYRQSPLTRVCQTACSAGSQCGAGDFCRAYTARPPTGVCDRRCTLGGSECPAGSTCRPLAALGPTEGTSAEYVTGCDRTGSLTAGMACARSEACGAGLACHFTRNDAVAREGTCRPVCDAMRPCPEGTVCFPFRTYHTYPAVNSADVGACVPM